MARGMGFSHERAGLSNPVTDGVDCQGIAAQRERLPVIKIRIRGDEWRKLHGLEECWRPRRRISAAI